MFSMVILKIVFSNLKLKLKQIEFKIELSRNLSI